VNSIIGIDCSTNPKKLGLCRGTASANGLIVEEVVTGAVDPIDVVYSWITDSPSILALDAPLGWPVDLGKNLNMHYAGQTIPLEGNQLFRRATDRFIKNQLGKQPLDVGADRITQPLKTVDGS